MLKEKQYDPDRYPKEPPPSPQYDISPELKKLVLMFMGAMIINFLIAGSLAIGMRIIQTDVPVVMKVGSIPQNVFWYALLTSHGQGMLFGVISVNTVWFGYYGLSKWGRKPLVGMKLAKASFWIIESAVIVLFTSGLSGFGAGWYNLMPLTFLSGRPMMAWGQFAAAMFLTAEVLIGVFLTLFCIVVIATLLKGKIAAGTEKYEDKEYILAKDGKYSQTEPKSDSKPEEMLEDSDAKMEDKATRSPQTLPVMQETMQSMPAAVRWVALLGINGWFPKKWRMATPAFPIVLVAIFVTGLIQLIGNPGLFLQISVGFMSLQNPISATNWLLTKQAWWFFGHPIVYFPILEFLGAAYFFMAVGYGHNRVIYDKWNYRPWPFYFMFSMLVYNHHIYMDMPNPVWLQLVSQAASLGIVWPSGLTLATLLMHTWRNKTVWNITTRFFFIGLAGWAFGGFQGAETGMWGTDIYQHNTMAMPGHIHLMLLAGALPMAFGVLYAILPDLTKKHMSKRLGEIHFWGTAFGIISLALLFTVIGINGAIRREAEMPSAFDWAMPWLLFFAIIIGITQFVFVFNFVKTLRRKPTKDELAEYDRLHQSPQGMGITAQ
ncbi:MAG: cbb3-type cytochrome c oxidase subunit I [Thermoproteota archaeon]|nr:cbb3-type cytochrome c oxidase subunit I [Thermoproteota archaeon]